MSKITWILITTIGVWFLLSSRKAMAVTPKKSSIEDRFVSLVKLFSIVRTNDPTLLFIVDPLHNVKVAVYDTERGIFSPVHGTTVNVSALELNTAGQHYDIQARNAILLANAQ